MCHVCTNSDNVLKVDRACNSTRMDWLVTDFTTGLDVISSHDINDEIVHGDRVNLTCAASKFEYDEVEWQLEKINGFQAVKSNANLKVVNSDTKLSHVSTLYFTAIDVKEGGLWRCEAKPKDRNLEPTSIERDLQVQSIISPVKDLMNNMNGSELVLETGSDVSLKCLASGRPKPTILWYKDEQLLDKKSIENSTSMELLEDDQVLHIEFAFVKNSGTYMCEAINRGGQFTASLKLQVKAQAHLSKWLIAAIVVALIVFIILSLILFWKVKIYNRKYKELTQAELDMFVAGDPEAINPELGVDDQADLLPYKREFEFARDKLKLGKQIGSGAFGRVVKAQAFGIVSWERSTIVAVKMVKQHADITYIRALMAELKIMMHLGKHLNIVNLLGACTTGLGKRELLVIVEYCR